jgi:hypothetical protein
VSLSGLAASAVDRRTDVMESVGMREMNAIRMSVRPRVTMGDTALQYEAPAGATAGAKVSAAVSDAAKLLSEYIPGEILTLYVAILAFVSQPSSGALARNWMVFWVFLVATPVVLWLLYAAEVKAKGKGLPWSPVVWPLWEMVAATIAYVAWAFAMPEAPFGAFDWYSAGLAGVVVLATTTLLGLASRVFKKDIVVA